MLYTYSVGCMYHTYIHIYIAGGRIRLASVGLAQARPNYQPSRCLAGSKIALYLVSVCLFVCASTIIIMCAKIISYHTIYATVATGRL